MGDANGRGGGNSGANSSIGGGGASGGVSNLSSTNPFLPLLQASTQFFSQTIQSFQTGLQQPPTTATAAAGNNSSVAISSRENSSNGAAQDVFQVPSAVNIERSPKSQGIFDEPTSHYSSSSTTDQLTTAPSRSTLGSVSSSVSTLPPGSAGLSMGELLFSAPPIYQSKDLEALAAQQSNNLATTTIQSAVISTGTTTSSISSSGFNSSSPFASQVVTSTSSSSSNAPDFSSYLTKHPSTMNTGGRQVTGPRLSTSGSPQHTRYNLYHQNSAENAGSPLHTSGTVIPPSAHSPPPGPGSRRASYPNRKEYPHETIPKSEFPQHIPYIPSPHHHHRGSTGGLVERKAGMVTESAIISHFTDPLRHHYLPPTAATPVQPFLEEQEEPPEEPCLDHQLSTSSNPSFDLEREDLKNRIMLETMREEIRIANERMADATKSLMMDDVFLPTSVTNNSTASDGVGNQHQFDSPRKASVTGTGNLSSLSSTTQDSSISNERESISIASAGNSGISSSTLSSSGSTFHPAIISNMSENTSTKSSLRKDVDVGKENMVAGGGNEKSILTSAGPLIHNNEPPICVNSSSNSASSSSYRSSRSRIETETGKYNMQGKQEELIESDSKNGYGNERAVSTSSNSGGDMNGATGNHVSPSSTTSTAATTIATNSERNEQQRLLKHQSSSTEITSVSALMNTLSSMGFNVMSSSSASPTATTTFSRPPTVGSYFKQNSRSFSLRQSSTDSIGSDSDLSSPTEGSMPSLQRAMSCDSVCSDTSVILGDLDPPHMTGHLCIGLEYDSETADLLVNVMEAKELVGPDPDPNAPFDSYVRVYLLPDKTTNMQTRVYRKSLSPVYKEKFMFGLEMSELANRSLVFYLYATDKYTNTLIGEVELKLGDMDVTQPVVTWLLLTDTGQRGGEFGEIMFSLSYLPTAERLTVVVVKARNLKFPHDRETGDPFVKVYLLQRGKKVSKKKSSTKRGEKNPIFNEAMIFSIPAHALQTIQLRITVADSLEAEGRAFSIGHVIVGSVATGKPLSHWNQMLSSLRKPIAMWHALRK
ncbi:unnamed protein product [Orchesella dallaii]